MPPSGSSRFQTLVRCESDRAAFEITGTTDKAVAQIVGASGSAEVTVSPASGVSVEVSSYDPESGLELPSTNMPRLFEETAYNLSVVGQPGHTVALKAVDASLVADVRAIRGHPEIITGPVNFRSQVGLVDLTVATDGLDEFRVTLEVFPAKLDYDTDYVAILQDVMNIARALGLEFIRATYRMGSRGPETPTDLEWATLLRNEIARLSEALEYIAGHPLRGLRSDLAPQRVEKIRRPSRQTLRAIARGNGSGESTVFNGVPIRERLATTVRTETLDIPEHRWIRRSLATIRGRLAELWQLEAQALTQDDRYRSKTVSDELAAMGATVSRLLRLEPMAVATGAAHPGFTSLALVGHIGYREAHDSLRALHASLLLDPGDMPISVKDLSRLYEMWCFLTVVRCVAKVANFDVAENMFALRNAGLRVALRKGRRSAITFKTDAREYIIEYNPRFPALTGTQTPDVVLTIRQEEWPPICVVFDAKYRLQADDRYVESFGGAGPPLEAVNALHRYRDAVTIQFDAMGLGRPVVKGIALFPLPAHMVEGFTEHGLWESLSVLGVGAIPLLPNAVDLFENWVSELLASDAATLAKAGPPFLAEAHARLTSQG